MAQEETPTEGALYLTTEKLRTQTTTDCTLPTYALNMTNGSLSKLYTGRSLLATACAMTFEHNVTEPMTIVGPVKIHLLVACDQATILRSATNTFPTVRVELQRSAAVLGFVTANAASVLCSPSAHVLFELVIPNNQAIFQAGQKLALKVSVFALTGDESLAKNVHLLVGGPNASAMKAAGLPLPGGEGPPDATESEGPSPSGPSNSTSSSASTSGTTSSSSSSTATGSGGATKTTTATTTVTATSTATVTSTRTSTVTTNASGNDTTTTVTVTATGAPASFGDEECPGTSVSKTTPSTFSTTATPTNKSTSSKTSATSNTTGSKTTSPSTNTTGTNASKSTTSATKSPTNSTSKPMTNTSKAGNASTVSPSSAKVTSCPSPSPTGRSANETARPAALGTTADGGANQAAVNANSRGRLPGVALVFVIGSIAAAAVVMAARRRT